MHLCHSYDWCQGLYLTPTVLGLGDMLSDFHRWKHEPVCKSHSGFKALRQYVNQLQIVPMVTEMLKTCQATLLLLVWSNSLHADLSFSVQLNDYDKRQINYIDMKSILKDKNII